MKENIRNRQEQRDILKDSTDNLQNTINQLLSIQKQSLEKGLMMLEMVVREGIEKGELRQVDPKIAAWYLMGVFSTYDMRIVGRGELPSEEEIRAMVDLAFEAIRNR